MYLGASHAIRFRFDGGLLSAVLLDPHRKPALPIREELMAVGVTCEPLAPSAATELSLRQTLGSGFRLLDVKPNEQPGTAVLRQRFSLRTPMQWLLRLDDGVWQATDRGAAATLPNRIRLAVETAAPCGVDGAGLRVSVPAGDCELTLTVTSEPVFPVGDTIVVCRPDQAREAAIVASCLPADRFIPIIAVEPPPTPRTRHIEIYRAYKQQQDQIQGRIGTPLGMAELVASGEPATRDTVRGIIRQRQLRAQLAPYRSWAKHNLMISKLVSRMGVNRAVFLHDFSPEELEIYDPAINDAYVRYAGDNGRGSGEIGYMFEDLPTKLRLIGVPVQELTTAAWRLLREPGSEPEHVVEFPASDPRCCVTALFTALRLGAALRAADRPWVPLDEELFARANPDGPEAVLVENTADATTLLGAIYAHHRAARLVVTPQPDLGPVQRAVADHQRRVDSAARAIDESKGIGFVEAVHRHLASGRKLYAEIEDAVTVQVPPSAINEVGDRRLTAFTTGLPYSFVRSPVANWSGKPIGHVAADAALILLSELYAAGMAQSAAAFSLVFDPGFFRVTEAPDVVRSVGAHFTYPLLLSGPAASMRALQSLPSRLPVELIFLNTHGTDNGIVLADVVLDKDTLPQWFEFDHRPIVFNNSCQSWTGVGREFIRIGARGYIGTLWSIPSRQAADFARIVIDRLTADAVPVADAIVNTGVVGDIERAYLYVGTANGQLSQWPGTVTSGQSLLAHCDLLAHAAASSDDDDLARALHREVTMLRRAAEGTEQVQTAAYVDTLLNELSLYTNRKPQAEDDAPSVGELVARIDDALSRLDLPPAAADRRWARRFEITGYLHDRKSEFASALDDFERSIGYGDAGQTRASLLLSAAQIHTRQGNWEEAERLIRTARDVFADKHDEAGVMRTVGMLGQLSKRLGRLAEAVTYAEQGHALAVKLENEREQGAFLLDQSTLHQANGNLDAAIAAAARALENLRRSNDDVGELSAIGRLGTCYRDKGELDTAMAYARTGLDQARKLGNPLAAAEFQFDIAEVLIRQHRHADALNHYRESVSTLVERGAWELASGVLARMAACATQLGDADALWSTATWGCTICARIDQPLWSAILPAIIDAIKEAFVVSPAAVLANRLPGLVQMLSTDDPPNQPQMILLRGVVALLWHWLSTTDQAETARTARILDAQTDGVLRLAEFVSVPRSQRARERR